MQPFNTLGHLNLKVNDLQASIDFYTRIGLPEFLRLTEEECSAGIRLLELTPETPHAGIGLVVVHAVEQHDTTP